jgi:hypothetical protein
VGLPVSKEVVSSPRYQTLPSRSWANQSRVSSTSLPSASRTTSRTTVAATPATSRTSSVTVTTMVSSTSPPTLTS